MENNKKIPKIRFAGFTDLPAGRQALGNWFVYVLLCENGSLYKGKTNHLERRMKEHFTGAGGAKHTTAHKPVEVVYFEEVANEEDALQREKYLKSGGGRE